MGENPSKKSRVSDSIKLSICIPTLNRARFLAETLENVISQANENIEIVIVDGASTDNTADVVQKFKQKFRHIHYHRGDKNYGVNRDMARTIELAQGEYCWLLSDDDLLKPGAIDRMLEEIKSECEIYLCNITACNLFMKPYKDVFWLSMQVDDCIFQLHSKNEFIQYCNKANSIGALFSYMSSLVICREAWNKTGFHYDFDDTAYALASSLFTFIKGRCRLKYIRSPLVLWRSDNESFQNEGGLVKRYLLDFDGYSKLADKYLSDDQDMRNSFLSVMRREHPWYTIIHVASFINDAHSWAEFKDKILLFRYNHKMLELYYLLGRCKPLIEAAVRIKRRLVRSGIFLINKK